MLLLFESDAIPASFTWKSAVNRHSCTIFLENISTTIQRLSLTKLSFNGFSPLGFRSRLCGARPICTCNFPHGTSIQLPFLSIHSCRRVLFSNFPQVITSFNTRIGSPQTWIYIQSPNYRCIRNNGIEILNDSQG